MRKKRQEVVIHVQGGQIAAIFCDSSVSVEIVNIDNLRQEGEEAERQGLKRLADACSTFKRVF